MLGSGDPQVWETGQRQVLMIRDPAAAEPIARILSMGSEKTRQLACDVLAQIPGEEASKFLARFALTDESEAVRQAAAKALRDRNDRGALGMLTNALNGSPQALDRAAYALGEIGDLSTAPALIGHLKTPETKVIKAPVAASGSGTGSSGAYITTGTIVTYIADAQPVVAQGAVGWDLQIGAVPVGTTLSLENPRVTIYRTIIEFVPRPAVRAALRKMTGKDCEYNPAAWREAVAGKP
jgi:hypothetical protein